MKIVRVTEAREKSGTLITVDMALEQGKDVYVVPGRITDRLSDGCNMLAKQGAGIILSPEAFYQELTGVEKNIQKSQETAEIMLDFEERAVLDCMDYEPVSVGEIMEKTGGKLGVSALNATLIKLCMEGRIKQVGNGFFSLK